MCLMYFNQFLFANLLKNILLSHVYNITWFAHIWHNIFIFFFAYEKKTKNAQKHAVLQQDLKFKKSKTKGGGTIKKIVPPLRFQKLRIWSKIQVYTMLAKCSKYFQKNFCCLKKIICTHSCTRLWHQGIIAISCRIWKQKFRFLEKKNVPDVLQSIFICKFAQKYLIVSYV